eukprot:13500150-Ditylum_brightwellii.AAC.1
MVAVAIRGLCPFDSTKCTFQTIAVFVGYWGKEVVLVDLRMLLAATKYDYDSDGLEMEFDDGDNDSGSK